MNHSVLTPMLNVGLIEPKEIIDDCLIYVKINNIPINSSEGFIRQIIGWREFIRGIYITLKEVKSELKTIGNSIRKFRNHFTMDQLE